MKAKTILKKLDYLPRWAWYLISFFIGGPFGILAVYLAFHVLNKLAKEQAQAEYESARMRYSDNTYRDEDCIVTDESHAQQSYAQSSSPEQDDDSIIDDTADLGEVIRAGHDAMRKIRLANDIIADEDLSRQIDSIENSCRQILAILEQRPQLLSQLRSFLRYYLPTTLRLLDARAKLENNAGTKKAREVRSRISDAVGTIDKAFLKQLEALDEYRFLDLESEMDVLRDMLKADGLVDEQDHTDDPFATTLGRK